MTDGYPEDCKLPPDYLNDGKLWINGSYQHLSTLTQYAEDGTMLAITFTYRDGTEYSYGKQGVIYQSTSSLNEGPTTYYQQEFTCGYNSNTFGGAKRSNGYEDGQKARIEDDYNRIQAQRLELAKWNRELVEYK